MGITTIKNCPCCKDKRCVCDEGCGYTIWTKSSWDPTGTWNKTTLAQVCQPCMSCMPDSPIPEQEGCNYPPTDEFGKCCGDCTWEKPDFSRAWNKVSTDCKEDCKCPDAPPNVNCDGYKEEDFISQNANWKRCYKHCLRPDPCCEINPDDPRAVDVSDKVLTCLDGNCPGYCQHYDTEFKAICCGDCSSSTSSTNSTSSESSKSTSSTSSSSSSSSSSSKSTSSSSSKSTSSESSKSTSSESSKSTSSESSRSTSSVSSVSTSSGSSVSSSGSSVSTSSVSSASESSSSSGDVCTCGYCTWYKIGGAGSWTKGDPAGGQSDFCTSGCACADDPPTGTTQNCDGYKTEPYGIDTYICYKCCTASSSSQSSASSSSSGCQCGCPVMCGADITGKMIDFAGPDCSEERDSAEFDLKYRPLPPPAIPTGWVLGDWWRGSVTKCGGTWTFVVFCVVGENRCDQLYALVDTTHPHPPCVNMTNGHDPQSPISSTGTACSCSPLVVSLGAFAGTSSGASGCCCAGCSPTFCNFSFTLYLTE